MGIVDAGLAATIARAHGAAMSAWQWPEQLSARQRACRPSYLEAKGPLQDEPASSRGSCADFRPCRIIPGVALHSNHFLKLIIRTLKYNRISILCITPRITPGQSTSF
jgi:hypothetical protein